MPHPDAQPEKSALHLKGKAAEEFLYALAQLSFLTDWCYLNPQLKAGKELCDLLVVFGDTALIWQVKNVKLDDGQFPPAAVEKNLRQLRGAKRQLIKLKKSVALNNPRRGREEFDLEGIRSLHLISALLGEEADFASATARDPSDGQAIHVFTRGFTETVFGELDTISDFVKYLRDKEELLGYKQRMILMGGEKQLLAYYLVEGRSFASLQTYTDVYLDDDLWEGYLERPEVVAKKEEDKISYLWDRLIDQAHASGQPEYEIIARELARANRFQRRTLSKALSEALKEPTIGRRFMTMEGVTYCFVLEDMPQEKRQELLTATCFVARGHFRENTKVVGIATEKTTSKEGSIDYCLLDLPAWSAENEAAADRIRKELGILQTPRETPFEEEEYPQSERSI